MKNGLELQCLVVMMMDEIFCVNKGTGKDHWLCLHAYQKSVQDLISGAILLKLHVNSTMGYS